MLWWLWSPSERQQDTGYRSNHVVYWVDRLGLTSLARSIRYTGQVTLFNEGVGASASSVGPGNILRLSLDRGDLWDERTNGPAEWWKTQTWKKGGAMWEGAYHGAAPALNQTIVAAVR